MKLKKWIKVKLFLFILVFVIILSAILYLYFEFKNKEGISMDVVPNNSLNHSIEEKIEEKKVFGINDTTRTGNLSFTLLNVDLILLEHPEYYMRPYIFTWVFAVHNSGDNFEKVSTCGAMVFDNTFQYDYYIEECKNENIAPQANHILIVPFYFSNEAQYPKAMDWESISSYTFTLYSQQQDGLLKYSINKDEIIIKESRYTS